jgi:hypothetical protein
MVRETRSLALQSVPHIVALFEDIITRDEPDYPP